MGSLASHRGLFAFLAFTAAAAGPAPADILVLDTGGRIRGRLLHQPERSAASYIIETDKGVRLTLGKSQVKQAIRQPPAEIEYEQMAPKRLDTVEDQWELAQWCGEHGLAELREFHLRRVIALDPDHAAARRSLGFRQLGGQWLTQSQYMEQQGYEFYRGRWRLAQEIELMERRREQEQAEKQWFVKLKRRRCDLGTDQAESAAEQILATGDPHAVKALARSLNKEPLRSVKLLYIEALSRIASDAATDALIDASLNDPDEEIFHACLDRIVSSQPPRAVRAYVKALQDQNNSRVNRAACALGRLGDPSAISPLIDALVTCHNAPVPNPLGQSPDSTTVTFVSTRVDGTTTPPATMFSKGGAPSYIRIRLQNQQVLDALVKIAAGANFGFDKRAWTCWLVTKRNQETVASVRRD